MYDNFNSHQHVKYLNLLFKFIVKKWWKIYFSNGINFLISAYKTAYKYDNFNSHQHVKYFNFAGKPHLHTTSSFFNIRKPIISIGISIGLSL